MSKQFTFTFLRCMFLSVTSIVILSLTACSPEFDWRTHQDRAQGQAFSMQFPGKPAMASREVVLANQSVQLTLHGVQAGGMQFVLGHAKANSAQQAKVLAQGLVDGFARNLSLSQPKITVINLPNTLGAWDVHFANPTTTAMARFIWTDNAVYELLTLGPKQQWSAEAADQFIRSIQFEPI